MWHLSLENDAAPGTYAVLRDMATKMVQEAGVDLTPQTLFLALLSLLSIAPQTGALSSTYWAYVPDPPVIHAATWKDTAVPIYTNWTWGLGGYTDEHISPEEPYSYSFAGITAGVPLCLGLKNSSGYGCLGMKDTRYEGWVKVNNILTMWNVFGLGTKGHD